MPDYIQVSNEVRNFHTMVKYYMQNFMEQTDKKLLLLFPDSDFAYIACEKLKKKQYSAFADPPVRIDDFWKTKPRPLHQTAAPPVQKDCIGMISFIDTYDTFLLVSGWLLNPSKSSHIVAIAQKYADDLAGETYYYQAKREKRRNLAQTTRQKQFLHTGFSLTVPGDQQYKLGYVFGDTLYQCNNIQFPTN